MQSQEEILSFLDFLALDEELIDTRLKSLMVRSNHSNKQFSSIIQLLLYKNLINKQEDAECENDEEINFIVKLLNEINCDNVDNICKIIKLVLCLNKTNIVRKSEHLLQQILSNINCQLDIHTNHSMSEETFINLKLCDSILDAILENNEKISLYFLEVPLERILDHVDDKLKIYFLTTTVPRLFECVIGYNILDRIWDYIKHFEGEKNELVLKILSSLSDFYLPVPDSQGNNKYISGIIFQYDFWKTILVGLQSNDSAVRKMSVFLSKKAIDCIMVMKKNVNIQFDAQSIFLWNNESSVYIKNMWDNFFILLDSLEEKQSNIVWPSLKLFESINIEMCWLNCAYNIGLKHDNTQIRLKCIEYRLAAPVTNQTDATIILEALNDINIFDQRDYVVLKQNISKSLKDIKTLSVVIKAIPHIKWSPVPYYHLTDVLSYLDSSIPFNPWFIDLLKVPCNNINIRSAIYINILYFIKKCCHNINWSDIANIILLQSSTLTENNYKSDPIMALIKEISVNNEEKQIFYDTMTETYKTIDIVHSYLLIHAEDVEIIIDIVNKKINKIHNVVNRQYSDKKECLDDVTFLIHLLNKTVDKGNPVTESIHELIVRQNKMLIQYIQSLLLNDTSLTTEEVRVLIENFDAYTGDLDEVILQLYKTCILFLRDTNDLDKTLLSTCVIKQLMCNQLMINNHKHEMLNVKSFLDITSNLKFGDSQNHSVGRLKNILYETFCNILYHLIDADNLKSQVKEIVKFVENILECGGYGCLKWVLKIMNVIIGPLLDECTNFDMAQFINRAWNELEELKSNNQYTLCSREFINLITHEAILEKSMFNNIVLLYCNKILEYGPVRNGPLNLLVVAINQKFSHGKNYAHLVFVLCEILLYCHVPRKDQRITDNVNLEILRNPKFRDYGKDINSCFNYEIQNEAAVVLTRINDDQTLQVITTFIQNKINETFRNKQRYHGNSQLHKMLLTALQHLLVLLLKAGQNLDKSLNWCFDLLLKLPHQTSVRIGFEWYISLSLYIQKTDINDELLKKLKSKNILITSQFFIIYWLLKHKIISNSYTMAEYEFVMDFLLSHTMGQLFNIRLHAQYLATKIYMQMKSPKYAYTIDIIERTFAENSNDKNFVKLKNDYFANKFDIVSNLSPYFIYYVLPRYCGDSFEEVDRDLYKYKLKALNQMLREDQHSDDFKKEWLSYTTSDESFENIEFSKNVYNRALEDVEVSGTIQKKYVPWKNMSDVNVYDISKKRESRGELIVVATLIDKLPNLGGMARTSEVFGVKTYVVDSLRHLQDKQFQGLSVSAEKWINIDEVRPGRLLKEYLMIKKSEGYSVVAAEQTSNSCKLQSFKFPHKTLLLLGHEKEGIPCDLLPIMDHCVEIPQQGYVRSLNVHVTAAIFIWEYARQNIL